jgi:hypothetical protein
LRYLRQNTAVSVVVGPFVDWQNGKSLLRDNADFVPADIVCELVKGIASSTLTLTKTGGNNDIVLTGKGLATLELTAANVDTLGPLRLSFTDALVAGSGFPTQTILSFVEDFMVLPAGVYDSLIGGNKLQVDIEQVKGSDIAGINDFKPDISGLSTFHAETDTVIVENVDDCKADVSALATQATADFIKNVLEADAEVDTTTTPWQLVIKHKTTGAVLIRKALKDVNGAGIISTATIIGQHKEPS